MSLALHRYFLRSPILGTLCLIMLGIGLERLIVTDKEAIEEVGQALLRTAVAEQWDAFEALVHPDFEYGSRERAQAVAHVRGMVRKYRPISPKISLYGIEVEGDRAICSGKISTVVYGRLQQLRIEALFERDEEGAWLLRSVEGALPSTR